MLSTEAPMNNPNKPPQFDMNADIVLVSERVIAMKLRSLNDITTLLNVLNLYLKRINDKHSKSLGASINYLHFEFTQFRYISENFLNY